MIDLIKELAILIPDDPENKAGWGPFTLPDRCDWMASVFWYHDHYYEVGPNIDPPMRLSDIDWRIFKALTILAEQPADPMERCCRAKDICKYWPIMRSAGHYLYARHHRKNELPRGNGSTEEST
jgi:hypothetical protein